MKRFCKFGVVLFNICLIIWAIVLPALAMASNESYYHAQFRKNGIYATKNEDGEKEASTVYYIGGDFESYAEFTDEQLDEIVEHIVDYLFRGKASFRLTMDSVMLNDALCDGVNIFGDVAVMHMKDVKILMNSALWIAIASFVICILLLVLFILNRKEVSSFILKYTLSFYGVLFGLVTIFLIWTLFFTGEYGFLDAMWINMHYLFFPFQPEKINGSSFNDTLTHLLTLELFVTAVVVVVSILVAVIAAWFVGIYFIRKEKKEKSQKT